MEFTYAVVAYLPEELRRFVDELRRRLNPEYAAWSAHLTVLPPRSLAGSQAEKLAFLEQQCAVIEPFGVTIGGVSTFWPVSGVVYLSVADGCEKLIQLHETLNVGELAHPECFPYVPHVTIAQGLDEKGTQQVLAEVSGAWADYRGRTSFRVESLSLVRQVSAHGWQDLAAIPLGSASVFVRR